MITDTYSGIAPSSVLPFIGAQIVGAALGTVLAVVLFPSADTTTHITLEPRATDEAAA